MKFLYLDTSAILKRYFDEAESEESEVILSNFQIFAISNIAITEALINIRRKLTGRERELATRLFEADLPSFTVVDFSSELGHQAVTVSDGKNLATLDSIHIATALRFKSQGITFLTYDRTQGLAAKRSGLKTLGAVS